MKYFKIFLLNSFIKKKALNEAVILPIKFPEIFTGMR